jgi:putative peptidoglycan lipid II flippase
MSRVARSAGVIGIATMTSRILGLARDQVLAYYFGASDAMDAFRIAFRIPNIFRDLFAEGAMSASLVPAFTRALAGPDRLPAWRLASNVITCLLVIALAIALCGMVFARPLVERYAAGFAAVPAKLDLTVQLTRIMFPFLPLVAMAAVLMGMLNALNRFFIPALSPATFNVATIVCAVVFVPAAPSLGVEPIAVIAWATLAGGAAQAALQWPVLHHLGFRYRPRVDLHDPRLREIGWLMLPGIAGLAAMQVNLFVNSWLASGLGTGAVSWLDYAFRLMYLPIGLFGVSIATASLPTISGHAATSDDAGVRRAISSGLRMILMLNIPATAGLMVLAVPIVTLIFERGRFMPADTAATAAALAFYAPGLIGYSAVKLISSAFYALGNSRIPLAASTVSVATNIVLNLAMVRWLGHRGIALGTAIAALVNSGLLLWFLRSRLGGLDDRRVVVATAKITLASLVMAGAAYYAERLLHVPFGGAGIAAQCLRVFGAIAIGMAVLGTLAHLLRIDEFAQLRRTAWHSRT